MEDVRLPKPVKDRVAKARREREPAQSAQETALSTTKKAAEALVRKGHLSMRDAAEVLALSHQRIQQLLAS